MFGKKQEETTQQDIESRVERKGSLEPYYILNAMNPSQQILNEEEEKGLLSLRPVQQIVNLLLKDVTELNPVFDLQFRARYPEVEYATELKPDEVQGLLDRLSMYHILDSHFYEKIVVCQKCSSANLAIRYQCPRCKSEDLSKHRTIEHVSCRYVALEEEFKQKNGIICPRCNAYLRQDSTDLKINDEGWWQCGKCSKRSRDPVIMYHCRQCDRMMYVGDVSFTNLYSYTLSDSVDRNNIILIEPIRDAIKKLGYEVESPGIIEGKSGSKYKFDIVCRKEESVVSVLDLVYSSVLVTDSHLNRFFCAIFDTKVNNPIMIAVPAVTETTSKLAEQYGITLIASTDMQEIIEKVKDIFVRRLATTTTTTTQSIEQKDI